MHARGFAFLGVFCVAVAISTLCGTLVGAARPAQEGKNAPAAGSNLTLPPEAQAKVDILEEKLKEAQAKGDKAAQAQALNGIAELYFVNSEYREALKYFDLALPAYQDSGDKRAAARTLDFIGDAWSALGEKQKALDYCNKALSTSREVADQNVEAMALEDIGSVSDDLDDEKKRWITTAKHSRFFAHQATATAKLVY